MSLRGRPVVNAQRDADVYSAVYKKQHGNEKKSRETAIAEVAQETKLSEDNVRRICRELKRPHRNEIRARLAMEFMEAGVAGRPLSKKVQERHQESDRRWDEQQKAFESGAEQSIAKAAERTAATDRRIAELTAEQLRAHELLAESFATEMISVFKEVLSLQAETESVLKTRLIAYKLGELRR